MTKLGRENENHIIDSSLVSKTTGEYEKAGVKGLKVFPEVLDLKGRFAIKPGY